jgi:hypothetical protein
MHGEKRNACGTWVGNSERKRQLVRPSCRWEEALFVICLHADFLLGLFFDPEEGGDMFL